MDQTATLTPETKSVTAYPAGLSAREVEVLRLVAEGLTNAQMAERIIKIKCVFLRLQCVSCFKKN